jgi:hypothetical protein
MKKLAEIIDPAAFMPSYTVHEDGHSQNVALSKAERVYTTVRAYLVAEMLVAAKDDF